MLLWEILDNAAASVGDRDAVVLGELRWSFAELADRARGLGESLRDRIDAGERVMILSDNSADYVAALYGVPSAGGVLLHGNIRHTPDELAAMAAHSGAAVLLGSPEHLTRLAQVELPSVRSRSELVATTAATPAARPGPAGENQLAWLMYTSGTTGSPKGVMLTHRSLISAALNTTMCRPVAHDEVYLFPFPLFHVAAYNVVHHHLRQRPVVLLPRFDPLAVLRSIEEEAVTSVSLAPTMLAMLLDHPDLDRFDLSTLRTVSYGAAAMPLDLLRRCLDVWPTVGLAQGYGMTELSGNAVFLSPEDHRRAATTNPELLGAAGRPAPMTALRIMTGSGTDAAPGESGEILVRSDQVCAGYFGDQEETAAAIADGWLHTGDIGRIDADGYLHVVDRLKDIIISGGENVSSREVEDALSTHPDISAVAVIGTPDDRWGEVVTAVVVTTDGGVVEAGQLRESCGHLAGFKQPRRVVTVESLPTNASGKVDKVALRSRLANDPF